MFVQPGGDAQAQGIQAYEAGGIGLIVGTAVIFKRGNSRIEQRVRRGAAKFVISHSELAVEAND